VKCMPFVFSCNIFSHCRVASGWLYSIRPEGNQVRQRFAFKGGLSPPPLRTLPSRVISRRQKKRLNMHVAADLRISWVRRGVARTQTVSM